MPTERPENPIESPAQRRRLTPRREPYWAKLERFGYLGYRRLPGGGSWIARLYDPESRKNTYHALGDVQAAGDDEYDQAAKIAQKWMRSVKSGVTGGAGCTVADACAAYVAALRARKGAKAAADAEGRFRRKIPDALGRKLLDRLRPADIREWRDSLIPSGLDEEKDADQIRQAKVSANRDLGTLRAALNQAWEDGRCASADAWGKVSVFEKVKQGRLVLLTPNQCRTLLGELTGGLRALSEAALLTGARFGELAKVCVKDFKGHELHIPGGKTGSRTVALSDGAVALLKRQAASKLPGALLFTQDDGTAWVTGIYYLAFRDAVQRAKLPEGTVFYTLRHTHISRALHGGVDIHSVAKNCGTSVAMIESHYGKVDLRELSQRLSNVALL